VLAQSGSEGLCIGRGEVLVHDTCVMVVQMVCVGQLNATALLNVDRAKILVAGKNEEVIRVLQERGEGLSLVCEQIGVSTALPEGSLDIFVKTDSELV
jgi:hypothetical protein